MSGGSAKISAKNLAAAYGKALVLDGEMIGVIGPKGSGKSTPLKAMGRL